MDRRLLPPEHWHPLDSFTSLARLEKYGASRLHHRGRNRNHVGSVCKGRGPVSAPAPALAKAPVRRIVIVRLADVSEAVAALSLVFALLLLVFPDSFPKLVVHTSQQGQLMPCMMAIALLFDIYLYLRV